MINVVICDDDINFLNILERKIQDYFNQRGITYSVIQYNSAESLLQSNIHQVDIIFLDVNLANMNGIEAAAILRRRASGFVLIFISGFLQYAPAGYQVKALRYLLKEQLNIFFEETMDESVNQLDIFRTRLSFKFINGDLPFIYSDNILLIQSHLHEIHFHFVNNKNVFYLYDKLDAIQNKLPKGEFIRIHQSHLVNFRYFLDAKNYRATLTGGVELNISQKLFPEVKKQLFLYRGKM